MREKFEDTNMSNQKPYIEQTRPHVSYHTILFFLSTTLVEQELLTLPVHLNSPPIFMGVRVTRSLVLCVCFVDRSLSSCTFSFGHFIVCSSSIYGFWILLWYLQTLLSIIKNLRVHQENNCGFLEGISAYHENYI